MKKAPVQLDAVYREFADKAQRGILRTPQGYFRNIYIDGPPTHGKNKDVYPTQICTADQICNR